MTQMSANHPLVSRISSLRQRARMLLGLYGAGYTLLALAAGIIVLVTADYLVHFDQPLVRVGLLAVLLAVVAAVAWRKLVLPLSTRMTDQFLASRVELVNKGLADELMSALQFIQQDVGRGNVMAAKVVEGAQERAAGIKFENALAFRTSGRAVAAGAAVVLLLAILGAANAANGNTGIAFGRWSNPFGGLLWPHNQDVEFDWSAFPDGKKPEVWAQGEPITVTAKVTRGFRPGMLMSVYFSSDQEGRTRDLMTLQDARSSDRLGLYQKELSAKGDKWMKLRVAAGDHYAQTEIRLAPLPVVSAVKSAIQPPAYVTGDGAVERTTDLGGQTARAVEGSMVHLTVQSSKPFALDGGVPVVALMRTDRNEPLAVDGMKITPKDPFTADLAFVLNKSLQFRAQVRDTDGFINKATTTMQIDAAADALPSVLITEPRREMEVTPDGEITVKINLADDLGLSELFLQATAYDAKAGDPPRMMTKLAIDKQVADGAARAVVGSTTYVWKLAELNLKPGDRLQFCALVRDNYAMPEELAGKGENFEKLTDDGLIHHRLVKSSPASLVVKSRDQITNEMVRSLESIAQEIQQLDTQEKQTKAKNDILRKAIEQSGTTTAQQQQDFQGLAQEQTAEAQRAMGIQQKIEQVRDTLKTNKMDQEQLGQLAQKASEVMKDVGQQDMPKATTNLNQAKDAAGNAEKQKSDAAAKDQAKAAAAASSAASEQQQTADAKMDAIAKEILQKGQLAQAEQKINELLKRTQQNENQTKETAKSTQGKNPSDLTQAEKDALAKIAAEQKDLAQQQQDLQAQLQNMAKDMQQSNPSGAKAAAQAAQTSQQQQVAQKQQQAGQSAQQNQTNSAQQQQQQAEAGLQQMQKDLKDAQKYEQERIAAETAKLLEEVKKVHVTQTTAKDDADKAGDKATSAVLKPLGDRENRMNLSLVTLRDRAAALPEGQPVADDLKDAQAGMQDATASLLKSQQPPAVKSEVEVLAALQKAIDKLQAQKDRNDAQAAKDELAAIRAQFEAARAKEVEFRGGITTMEQHKKNLGDLPAADQVKLGDMSKKQGDLAENVHTLTTGKLQEFEEYVYITNQVVDFMGESRNRMAKAETGREVAMAQDSAILRLTSIIDALKEEEEEKDKFLKEQKSGGGGGGQKPLIPPLAELKLLKRLHGITTAETLEKNNALKTAANDGEKATIKAQVERLGDDQNKVSDLAKKVWEKLSQ